MSSHARACRGWALYSVLHMHVWAPQLKHGWVTTQTRSAPFVGAALFVVLKLSPRPPRATATLAAVMARLSLLLLVATLLLGTLPSANADKCVRLHAEHTRTVWRRRRPAAFFSVFRTLPWLRLGDARQAARPREMPRRRCAHTTARAPRARRHRSAARATH
jgi:hypothetical protein